MIKKLLTLNVVAAMLWAGAVAAQENQADTTTAPQTQAGADLDLGEEGPRVGSRYIKEEHGDWMISCVKTEAGEDPCFLRQILAGDQGQPIADITIQNLPEGSPAAARATVVVPLEILLQAQLALSIDGAPGKRYNYHHCNPVGCLAQLGFTQGDIDAMKAGTTATLSLVSLLAPTQLLEMEVSLAGFTAGFDTLEPAQN
ncbi:invasion associated locus B family protein [Ruegeria lacuscaerulensis]|uniref:invasion associated locus B family protein n=1 Tax=Ruegeria lacuscaerulensis TaxID=55218 RepID=UPI00147B5799|nr:invasion associated locus B family protein [Ruegeria lacuscaerulensis]